MKKLIILSAVAIQSTCYSQTKSDLFSQKEFTIEWVGIDFSHSRYLGNNNPNITKYFPDHFKRINNSIKSDNSRFYFNTAYKKTFVYNTKYVDSLNSFIDSSIVTNDKKALCRLSELDIDSIVSGYKITSNSGVCLTYIADGLNDKGDNFGCFWIVFFNPKTNYILFKKNIKVAPRGASFDEEWANSALEILRASKKNWSDWQK